MLQGLGGTNIRGNHINEADIIAGYSQTSDGDMHAVLWNIDGEIINELHLTGTESVASSINDIATHVVGQVDGSATLWLDDQQLDLLSLLQDSMGWTELSVASDVNDSGYIVGQGILDGETHVFLLTPVIIPEPASVFLLLSGAGALIRRFASKK